MARKQMMDAEKNALFFMAGKLDLKINCLTVRSENEN
jgi:hypothetical protein